MRDKAKWKAAQQRWRQAHPETVASSYRRYRYAIEPHEYDLLLKKQGCACAICRRPETVVFRGKLKTLSVDHDHKTGRIRGLLCQRCNLAVGNLEDSADRARAVAFYLEKP